MRDKKGGKVLLTDVLENETILHDHRASDQRVLRIQRNNG